ncbi:MAG: ABC transporter permease [Sarcina sp.]
MFFKIALNNVKKSYKDYGIYFLTLTLGVCIFYAFNSIDSQSIMGQLSTFQMEAVRLFEIVISVVSIFISFILGSLIIYANNFLIKKRKKELGIYITLGMSKRKVSGILIVETFIIGIFSLAIGLLLGIILSQGISVIVAKLFNAKIISYSFVFSLAALIKTISYFSLIFLIIIIFNTIVITKYNLLDLIYAGRKNEKVKLKDSKLAIFILSVGVLMLAFAYYKVSNIDRLAISFEKHIIIPAILGFVGTFMFYFGFSTLISNLYKRNKKSYNRGINSFVARQLENKFNTNFIAISVISLMLFLTISSLAAGLGFKMILDSELKRTMEFDATMHLTGQKIIDEESERLSIDEVIKALKLNLPKEDSYADFKTYYMPIEMIGFLEGYINEKENGAYINFISIEDYNNIRKLQGKDIVNLKDNELLFITLDEDYKKSIGKAIKDNFKPNIKGNEYIINKKYGVIEESYSNFNEGITIVATKSLINLLEEGEGYRNVKYANYEKSENIYREIAMKGIYVNKTDELYLGAEAVTKELIKEQSNTTSTMMLFIGIYMGIILLLSSTAVLAIQQLSEASDSIERYNSLKKIGVPNSMIKKGIFKQILIYFMAPMSLAIVDSIFGIKFINTYLGSHSKGNIILPTLIVGIFIFIIYVGYFISTYIGCKNILLDE